MSVSVKERLRALSVIETANKSSPARPQSLSLEESEAVLLEHRNKVSALEECKLSQPAQEEGKESQPAQKSKLKGEQLLYMILDISTSMSRQVEFKGNQVSRLQAVCESSKYFESIDCFARCALYGLNRNLVPFVPLTSDHGKVFNKLDEIKTSGATKIEAVLVSLLETCHKDVTEIGIPADVCIALMTDADDTVNEERLSAEWEKLSEFLKARGGSLRGLPVLVNSSGTKDGCAKTLESVMGDLYLANATNFQEKLSQMTLLLSDEAEVKDDGNDIEFSTTTTKENQVDPVVDRCLNTIDKMDGLITDYEESKEEVKEAENDINGLQSSLVKMQGAVEQASPEECEKLLDTLEGEQEEADKVQKKIKRTQKKLLRKSADMTGAAADLKQERDALKEQGKTAKAAIVDVKLKLDKFRSKTKLWARKVSKKLQSMISTEITEKPPEVPQKVLDQVNTAAKALEKQMKKVKAMDVVLSSREAKVLASLEGMAKNLRKSGSQLEEILRVMGVQNQLEDVLISKI